MESIQLLGCHTLNYWRFMLCLLTLDQAGPLGETGGPSIGNGRECDEESRHVQGCSQHLCRDYVGSPFSQEQ
jgi:hypothetical protein